ncbi:hypothetical protein CNQ87_13195 [Lysinibacillus fusiformis]|uniref:Yip1 family protein n=1 Tax=Lysinibacillus fusiformis TaxID=28031 RepID=UPI000BBB14E5|nr:Yip1 family protein [Lysinibacillus fusiformis]PCD81604.1 hypothetical protein CNQ87_13195 [Lysinibacillus fusiformis]
MTIEGFFRRFWITILLVIIFLLQFYLSKFTFFEVPINNFNVPAFISICIGSLSSLLGIIVSVLILGITLSEQTFGSRLKYVLLNESSLINFFIVSLFCIFTFILINFIYNGTVTNLIVNLTIYAVILYVLAILSIYPLIKIFLLKATSKKHIDKLLSNINFPKGEEYLKEKHTEENTFYILEGIGLNAINSNDRKSLHNILNGFIDFFYKEIEKKDHLEANSIRDIINIFVKIQSRWLSKVKSDSEEWVVLYFMKFYKSIRVKSTEKNFNHFNFFEYDFFIERSLKRVDPFLETQSLIQIQHFLIDIYKANLNQFVPIEELTMLNSEFYKNDNGTNDSFRNDQQWGFLQGDFRSKFDKIARINGFKEEERISHYVISYNSILSEILSNEKLTEKQKLVLTRSWTMSLKEYLIEAIKNNSEYIPYTITYLKYPAKHVENTESNYWLISIISEILLYLFKNGKLKKRTVNDFGGIVRLNLERLEIDSNAKAVIMKISNILYDIAMEIQKSEENLNFQMMENYIEIYKEIESFIKFSRKEENKISEESIEEWKDMLDKLVSYDKFKASLEDENNFWNFI